MIASVSLATTDPKAKLGDRYNSPDGNSYQYVRANGALVVGTMGIIDEAGDFTPMTTTNAGAIPTPVGAAAAIAADNEYLWAVRRGASFTVLAKASCVLDVKLYTHASAGYVDDTITTLVEGLRLNATVGGSDAAANASAAVDMTVNTYSDVS